MIKNIFESLQDVSDTLREKANEWNNASKEKWQEVKEDSKTKLLTFIEEWVEILPKLVQLGFEVTSFGVSMSISPCLLAELKGKTSDFSEEKILEFLNIYQKDKSMKLFLNVLKTTMALHKKAKIESKEDIIVRIEVKLSPEIKVFIGKPELI